MAERTRVSAAELKAFWFTDEAETMVQDYKARVRIVRMADGTEYETPLDDIPTDPGDGP